MLLALMSLLVSLGNQPELHVSACQDLRRLEEEHWAPWRVYGRRNQDRRVKEAERACQEGVGDCCFIAAVVARSGVVATKDPSPRRFLELGCGAHSADACWLLSEMYATGEGGAKRERDAADLADQAVKLFADACDAGEAGACVRLAVAYGSERVVGKHRADALPHYAQALQLYRARCSSGDADACRRLGLLIDQMGSCRSGDTPQEDCSDLLPGVLPTESGTLPVDVSEAIVAFRRGCDAGDGMACSELSLKYLLGRGGVSPDNETAVALQRRACQNGFAQACLFLGRGYKNGGGDGGMISERYRVEKDVKTAVALFERGCRDGEAFCCYELAEAYRKGQGIARDPKKAKELLMRSCDDHGLDAACEELGKPEGNR